MRLADILKVQGVIDNLKINGRAGIKFEGLVIYPYLDRSTRDIKLRMKFDNSDGELMPGMFGTLKIASRIDENGLLIPDEAVIHSGDSRVVFIALSDGKFAPREIIPGVKADGGMVQVLDGLDAGETVVTSAQFLLDSESRLKEALNKMLTGAASGPGHIHTRAEGGGSGEWVDLAPDDPNAKFACPMEEDRYYTSEDGECPICGMFLQPHDPSTYKLESGLDSDGL